MSTNLDRARAVTLLVILLMLSLPASVALANAGPPPIELWLDFVYQTSGESDLEGVQIAGCRTLDCDHPTLLQQYGTCDSEGCLDSSPSLNAQQSLDCLENRCVAILPSSEVIPPFKIIGDFSDRVRESDVFPDELSYGTAAFEVAVLDAALLISQHEIQDPYDAYFDTFFLYFAVTIIVELLAAVVVLSVWLKLRKRSLLQGLGYVLLAGLVSYPVTWILWPSLGRFQPVAMRQMGVFVIFGAMIFSVLLTVLSRSEGKARRNWWILTLALLPVSVFATLACLVLSGMGMAYGMGNTVAVQGLPSGLNVAFSEAFAISFEALLLYLLARKTLALSSGQAALISLVANISSFLAGLALKSWF